MECRMWMQSQVHDTFKQQRKVLVLVLSGQNFVQFLLCVSMQYITLRHSNETEQNWWCWWCCLARSFACTPWSHSSIWLVHDFTANVSTRRNTQCYKIIVYLGICFVSSHRPHPSFLPFTISKVKKAAFSPLLVFTIFVAFHLFQSRTCVLFAKQYIKTPLRVVLAVHIHYEVVIRFLFCLHAL